MKSNPDYHSDNAEKLKQIVEDTHENIHAAKASIAFTDSKEQK